MQEYAIEPDKPEEMGWERLKEYVTGLSWDTLLNRTGIAKNEFIDASRLIFENVPGCNLTGLGLELQPNGVQSIRTVACLQSLMDTGRFPSKMDMAMNPLPNRDAYPERPDPVGFYQAPLFVARGGEGQAMYLPRAVLNGDPYPVRALVVMGANPALTFPAASTQVEMYRNLDFLAVCDLFMTATARHADLVLPAADFLNTSEIHDYGRVGKPYFGLIRRSRTVLRAGRSGNGCSSLPTGWDCEHFFHGMIMTRLWSTGCVAPRLNWIP